MADYIERQAAIELCDWYQHEFCECDYAFGELANELHKLPSAQQWIPCSDRYPDMDERVLVYTVAHEYHVWDCMSNRADNYFWEDEAGLYHDKYVVDLWMPLPEPYKENT